jgi:hypothetical protein
VHFGLPTSEGKGEFFENGPRRILGVMRLACKPQDREMKSGLKKATCADLVHEVLV